MALKSLLTLFLLLPLASSAVPEAEGQSSLIVTSVQTLPTQKSVTAPTPVAPRILPHGTLGGPFQAHVLRVIDGDTVEVRVTLWLEQELVTRVRLRDVDAPELKGRCDDETQRAQDAKDHVAALVEGRDVYLIDVSRDKYGGRVVARLLMSDGTDLAEELLGSGLARPYAGKRRESWCDSAVMAQR